MEMDVKNGPIVWSFGAISSMIKTITKLSNLIGYRQARFEH